MGFASLKSFRGLRGAGSVPAAWYPAPAQRGQGMVAKVYTLQRGGGGVDGVRVATLADGRHVGTQVPYGL